MALVIKSCWLTWPIPMVIARRFPVFVQLINVIQFKLIASFRLQEQ